MYSVMVDYMYMSWFPHVSYLLAPGILVRTNMQYGRRGMTKPNRQPLCGEADGCLERKYKHKQFSRLPLFSHL